MDVICGLASNQNLCDGATAIGNATNLGSITMLAASGGNQTAGNLGALVTSVVSYETDPTALNGAGVIDLAADLGEEPVTELSPPGTMVTPTYITVDGGQAPSIDYGYSSYDDDPDYGGGGGGGVLQFQVDGCN
jgi:hypothetical protein